jgi:hypothetical protein
VEAFNKMKLARILLESLGRLYRDIVVTCSSDFVEYTLKGGCFTYKNILPFNMTLGIYRFLKKEDFYALISGV